MQLLSKVDEVLGNKVMDKPMFPIESAAQSGKETPGPDFVREIAEGKYDALFPGTTEKVSSIYQSTKRAVPLPDAALVRIEPSTPDSYIAPMYPPIAKAARVEGEVSFRAKIGAACTPDEVEITGGPKMLQQAVTNAVKQWCFSKVDAGRQVEGAVAFRLNCPPKADSAINPK